MQIRTSEATWDGTLQDGKGRFWTESGEVSGVFSFPTRFEDQPGTNPEELIGAALASCFSMALAGDLGRAGHAPESVRTVAMVHLDKGERGFAITGVDLDSEATVTTIESDASTRSRRRRSRTARSAGVLPVPITLRTRLSR